MAQLVSDLGFTRPKSRCWPGVFFLEGLGMNLSKLIGIIGSVQFYRVLGLRSRFLVGWWPGLPVLEAALFPGV